jgi:hypothetical protein
MSIKTILQESKGSVVFFSAVPIQMFIAMLELCSSALA